MKALGSSTILLVLAAGLSAQEQGSFERSLSVSGPVELDVKTDSGGITVRQGSSGTVFIRAVLKADHGWFGSGDVKARIEELERHPPIEQNGNRLRIGYVLGRDLLKNISMHFDIETPAESQLRARADSGGIKVEGIRGPVDCKTDSGGVEVNDSSADVRAATDSGGIHIRNVGSLFARADSGGIDATRVGGSIDAQTDSGSVRLEQTTAAPINAKAESGGVNVMLARGAGYDIRAQTDSGRVSVPEMTVRGSVSPQRMEGKVRSGGPLVRIQVNSGNITIE